jgi:hypothetical protein
VEFALYPEAGHVPVLPADRLAIQGGDVDWFDFWLRDQEDPAPQKAQQYVRWREMRQLQHAACCGRSVGSGELEHTQHPG